jgi:hypothetical protein
MFIVDMPSPDELLRTAGLSIAAALLAFELIVAARSWYDAWSAEHGRDHAARWLGPPDHGQLLLSQAYAIRGHLAERRHVVSALRRQYAALGTNRYGRQLRGAIGRIRPARSGEFAADCQACRVTRLKGRGRCLECGRRLILPAVPAGA